MTTNHDTDHFAVEGMKSKYPISGCAAKKSCENTPSFLYRSINSLVADAPVLEPPMYCCAPSSISFLSVLNLGSFFPPFSLPAKKLRTPESFNLEPFDQLGRPAVVRFGISLVLRMALSPGASVPLICDNLDVVLLKFEVRPAADPLIPFVIINGLPH